MNKLFGQIALSMFLTVALSPLRAAAAVPQTFTQQGRLLNTDGTPVAGPVRMIFNVYDSASATTPLWTETQSSVVLDNGAFSVQLGGVTPFPSTLWGGATMYLGVTIGNDPEMTPREQITSVPYALMCGQADHATNADQLGGQPAASYALGSQLTAGTVTSVGSGAGLTGGPITSTGTLAVEFAGNGTATSVAHSDHVHSLVVYNRSSSATVAAGSTGTVNQGCNAGEQLVGGSCDINTNTGIFVSRYEFWDANSTNAGPIVQIHCVFGSTNGTGSGTGYGNALCLTVEKP